MSDPTEKKASLRSAFLDRRARLSLPATQEAGGQLVSQLQKSGLLAPFQKIGSYRSYRNEIPTQEIFSQFRREGKNFFYPRVRKAASGLDFVAIDEETQFLRGAFGIEEPAPFLPAHPLQEIDALLIPGVAFDLEGGRVGWGKGLYDRVLKGYGGLKIGLAYDFQITEALTLSPWDEKVDWVVTEKRFFPCRPA